MWVLSDDGRYYEAIVKVSTRHRVDETYVVRYTKDDWCGYEERDIACANVQVDNAHAHTYTHTPHRAP